MKLSDIDPALSALPQFAKATKGSTRQVERMRQENIYADGALSAKSKTIMAVLWSIAVRCEPCLKYYAHKASQLGATETELGEAYALATTMGACVAETWALKAFAARGDQDAPAACPC